MGVRQITHSSFVMLLLIDIGILAEAEYVFFEQQADVVHQRHIDILDRLLLLYRQRGGEVDPLSGEYPCGDGQDRGFSPYRPCRRRNGHIRPAPVYSGCPGSQTNRDCSTIVGHHGAIALGAEPTGGIETAPPAFR